MGDQGMGDSSWKDQPRRLLKSDGEHLFGPGHNSVVVGPNNIDQYIVYHAWEPDWEARRLCFDRLFWHGDELWTAGPNAQPQPIPGRPRFLELFDRPELSSSWQDEGGIWRISQNELRQEDLTMPGVLYYKEKLSQANLLEVNMRRLSLLGSYGLMFQGIDHQAAWLIVTPDRIIQIWSSHDLKAPFRTISLPEDFDPLVYHQLLISNSGQVFQIHLDRLLILEERFDFEATRFALLTEEGRAAFSTIVLTDAFRDEFQRPEWSPAVLGWQAMSGDLDRWIVQDEVLQQTSEEPGESLLLKNVLRTHYEAGVSFKVSSGSAGLVLQSANRGIVISIAAGGNDRYQVEIEGLEHPQVVELSHEFDISVWHTLRVERIEDQLIVYLDGPEVLRVGVPGGQERIGLWTRSGLASFIGVWQTDRP